MTKGKILTHTLKVLNDPKVAFPLIEWNKRNYTRVVQQNEELAYAVYEIDETVIKSIDC
jgi:glycine betaine/choline ABC-type transport system substrate-binding protein